MIIVSGTTTLKPGQRDSVLARAIIFTKQSLTEPGCRAFVFAADVSDMRVIHHYEEWEDEAALAAHLASDHVKSFTDGIAELRDEGRVMRYDVVESAPLASD